MELKTKINFVIHEFSIPDFVYADIPVFSVDSVDYKEQYHFDLSALEPSTLKRLCDKFTEQVFKSAGKQQPDTAGPEPAKTFKAELVEHEMTDTESREPYEVYSAVINGHTVYPFYGSPPGIMEKSVIEDLVDRLNSVFSGTAK